MERRVIDFSIIGLEEVVAPNNKFSPTMGQVEALYLVSKSEAISKDVMDAVVNVSVVDGENVKSTMDSWNDCVGFGMGEAVKSTMTQSLSKAIALSSHWYCQEDLQLRVSSLATTLYAYTQAKIAKE